MGEMKHGQHASTKELARTEAPWLGAGMVHRELDERWAAGRWQEGDLRRELGARRSRRQRELAAGGAGGAMALGELSREPTQRDQPPWLRRGTRRGRVELCARRERPGRGPSELRAGSENRPPVQAKWERALRREEQR